MKKKVQGQTLVEVLVALMVLMIALFMFTRAMNNLLVTDNSGGILQTRSQLRFGVEAISDLASGDSLEVDGRIYTLTCPVYGADNPCTLLVYDQQGRLLGQRTEWRHGP